MGKKLLSVLALFLVAVPFGAIAQNGSVTGRVTDGATGEEMPGTNVYLLEIKRGASSDVNGSYVIPMVPAGNYTVVASYLGYKQYRGQLQVGDDQVTFDIKLQPDLLGLEEVVISALGFEEQRDKSAKSTVNVGGAAVQRSGENSVLTGLSAKAPGVNITRSGGDPGTGGQILIRGASTVTGDVQPLFVVDGVPVSNSGGGSGVAGTQQQNRINDLNPDDIESVEVLKGASAAALWGSRAANGVIMIKTKRGKYTGSDKVNISVKSNYAVDEVNRAIPLQQTWGQGSAGRFAQANVRSYGDRIADRPAPPTTLPANTALVSGDVVSTLPGQHAVDKDGNIVAGLIAGGSAATTPHGNKYSQKTIDQFSDVFRQGTTWDNAVTISGGNDKSNFYLNASQWLQEGVVKNGSDYDRTSIRANVEHRFSSKFRSAVNANFIKTVSNRVQQGSNLNGIMLGGTRTPADFDNAITQVDFVQANGLKVANRHRSYRNQYGQAANPGFDNPQWTIQNNKSGTVVNRFMGSAFLSYDATDWLNINYRAGVDNYNDRRYDHFATFSAGSPAGFLSEQSFSEYQVNQDLIVQANKQFSEDFSGSILAGFNFNHRETDNVGASISAFVLPDFERSLSNSPAANRSPFQSRSTIRTAAFYTEARGEFKNQLFATATVRGETASTFGPLTDATFVYPSAEIAWQFTNLEFLRGNKALSFGKLRATYGTVGRQPGFGAIFTNFVTGAAGESWGPGLSSAQYGGGFIESVTLGNQKLKPERKTELEIGADMRFMDDRISFSVTGYQNRTVDAILNVATPASSGFSGTIGNAAEVENKGLELQLDIEWIRQGSFSWTTSANWFRNRNTVVDLEGAESLFLAGFAGTSSRAVVGHQLGTLWGGRYLRDADGKMVLDSRGFPRAAPEEGVLGDPNPEWRAGISNTIRYKGLTVNALFDIKHGGKMWNGTRGALVNYGTHKSTDVWTTNNTGAAIPRYNASNGLSATIANGESFRGTIKDFGGGNVALDQNWWMSLGGGFGPVAEDFIEDGGFVRFRELSVSYNLSSKAFREATKLQSLEVSFTARNLMLWTNYSGIDPETNLTGATNGQGLDYYQNPNTRSFMVGLKFNY